MKEMLIAGRGGQGVVLASQLLADTFARAGFLVQSFPEFKAERRGAPISAFLRWDERADPPAVQGARVRRARRRSPPTPPSGPGARRRCGRAGSSILNRDTRYPQAGAVRRRARRRPRGSPATTACSPPEGRPMGNVAMLGACVRLLLPEGLPFLEQAIEARFGALAGPNLAAARDGLRAVPQAAPRSKATRRSSSGAP